jgi:hypothetical protein
VSDTDEASSETTEPEYTPEQWVYLGVHPDKSTSYMWRTPTEETLVYAHKDMRSRALGGVHVIAVRRVDEHIYVSGGPSWTGEWAEDSAQIQLTSERREANLRAKKLLANTSRLATIDEALAPLLEVASRTMPLDRDTLVTYVTRRLYATPTPRRKP